MLQSRRRHEATSICTVYHLHPFAATLPYLSRQSQARCAILLYPEKASAGRSSLTGGTPTGFRSVRLVTVSVGLTDLLIEIGDGVGASTVSSRAP